MDCLCISFPCRNKPGICASADILGERVGGTEARNEVPDLTDKLKVNKLPVPINLKDHKEVKSEIADLAKKC